MIAQLFANGIIAGSIYTLVALGFGLMFHTANFLNFAHGAVYTCGAYFAYYLVSQAELPRVLAFPFACCLAMLVGCLLEVCIFKPLRARGASSLSLLLSSLGLYLALQNVVSLLWGNNTKTLRTAMISEGHGIFGARVTTVQIIIVVSAVILTGTFALLMKTRLGRTLRAVANDPSLSRIVGVNPNRMIMFAFAIASFLAGAAAILLSFETDLNPTMGFKILVMGVIVVVIGGLGSLPGAALGGLLLGLAENLAVWRLPAKWQDAIAFLLLMLFLLLRPQGIFGTQIRKASV